MKTNFAVAIALTLLSASMAFADSRIETLCGVGHLNEVEAADDVLSNPDGFYIRSLQTQISYGDPRIIQTNGSSFHLCTASAANPDMDNNKALLLMNERRVTYLFAPINCPKQSPTS